MGDYSLVTHLADRASLLNHETLEGVCSFKVVMDGMQREYEWVQGTCTYLEDQKWEVAQ